MNTLRQIVSDIRSMNKLTSSDNTITDRAIASEVRTTSSLLIRRELLLRRLWNTPTIFTNLKCLQMCEVPLAECCSYKSPCTIRKSSCKIVGIADLGTFGLAIQGVFNIDGTKKFKETNPSEYENILKLGLKNKTNFYWFQDQYLYIADPDVEAVNLIAYFEDFKLEGENCQCDNVDSSSACTNPLDMPFKCPDYLVNNVKTLVNQSIGRQYRTAIPDMTSDEKDDAR